MVERRGNRVTTAVTRIIIAETVSQKIQIHSLIREQCNLTFSSLFQRRGIFIKGGRVPLPQVTFSSKRFIPRIAIFSTCQSYGQNAHQAPKSRFA